jgi:hypothetical protein
MAAHRARLRPLVAAALLALLGGCAGALGEARPGPQTEPRALPARPPPSAEVAPRVSATPEAAPAPTASESAEPPPSFPAGWTAAGAAIAGMGAPAKGGDKSLKRLLESSLVPRIPISPVRFRISDLSRIEIEPEPDWNKEPTSRPAFEEAKDLLILGSRVTVRDRPFGFVEVSFLRQPFYAFAQGGVSVYCGSSTGYRRAEWESLTALPDGSFQYENAVGWFDHQECKGYALQRVKTTAREIADGIVYAFRTTCPKCKGTVEKLHILAPRADWDSSVNGEEVVTQGAGAYSHTELALRPGVGGSMLVRFTPSAIEDWKKSGARPARHRHGILGVEVTQGVSESEPVAVVYVADRPPP